MQPDFNKATVDTLAKRAAYRCSNPECRVSTVGPNSDPEKATIIGEAAHIYGARADSARYDIKMSDVARSEITNAIWLCRNCHKKIDRDASLYPTDLLFSWRDSHEHFVAVELGSVGARLRIELEDDNIQEFQDYPPIVRRIVIDQPQGWEWRLTAELLRHLNKPLFRKLQDLRSDLYTRSYEHLDEEEAMEWVNRRLTEMSSMISPIVKLLDRLTQSWGKTGESGNIEEIHHVCLLIRDYLEQIIEHEERIHFVKVPEKYERLAELFRDVLGSQADKLRSLPNELDDIVSMLESDHGGTAENPTVIKKTITFELPQNWEKNFNREVRKVTGKSSLGESSAGCLIFLIIFLVIFAVL